MPRSVRNLAVMAASAALFVFAAQSHAQGITIKGVNPLETIREEVIEPIQGAAGTVVDQAGNRLKEINKAKADMQNLVNRFQQLKRKYNERLAQLQSLEAAATSGNRASRERAYRELQKAGVLRSNRAQVREQIRKGVSAVVEGAELDHLDQIELVSAVGASIATANPGPVAAKVQRFILESKQAFLKNLKDAPQDVRTRLSREFESIMKRALETAVRNKKAVRFKFRGMTLVAGLATYKHWVDVPVSKPRLVRNGTFLGVALYRLEWDKSNRRIGLPNTFQPYVKAELHYAAR